MRAPRRSAAILLLALLAGPVEAGEWAGLKIGVSTAQDAKRLLGKPSSEYPDSLLFPGDRITSPVHPDTIGIQIDPNQVVESLFIFPLWGVTNVDVQSAFGRGKRRLYGEFLEQSGIKTYGAGTRAAQKLHYLPLDLPCEVFSKEKILVVYEDRDLSSGDQIVKLILFY